MKTQNFIKRAQELHGDKYDYSLVEYKSARDKVKIICKKHGIFEVTPDNHISKKSGCRKCFYESRIKGKEYFIKRAQKTHGDIYDYSLFEFETSTIKSKIICKKCNNLFLQDMHTHIRKGCPYCRTSRGEKRIKVILEENGYILNKTFFTNKSFENLKDKKRLSYDFYIPSKNLLIEFNGVQHYKFNHLLHRNNYHNFLVQKHHDWLKRKYARDNKIDLLTISHKDDNIQKIIMEKLYV